MKTRRAYLASFTTTGTLVAGAVAVFLFLGVIVAFEGFPGGSGDRAESVRLGEDPPSVSIVESSFTRDLAAVARSVGVEPAPGTLAAERLVGEVASLQEGGGSVSLTPGPGDPGEEGNRPSGGDNGQAGPRRGGRPDGNPGSSVPPPPTANDLARATERLSGEAGGTVGGVSPGVGGQVANLGGAVADVVEGAPPRPDAPGLP